MKHLLFTISCLLLACLSAAAQQVTFVLHAPSLPDSSTVYITGNQPQLGNWNPGQVAMQPMGNHTWQKQVQMQQPEVAYKYTLGSWEREAADSTGKPLQNFSLSLATDTTLRNDVQNWTSGHRAEVKGGVTGTVRYHRHLQGQGLQPRDLVVWLPHGYDSHKHTRYPVLYMHDGQNIFDPATSSFGVDWRIDETADSLIKAHAMEPVIIVGIYNTPDRSEEYIPGGKGSAYMDFVVQVVKPLIDQTYRTKRAAKYTATGGSSAGGIMAFMLAWEHPEVFSKAICMSPAFRIENIDYVDDVRAYTGPKKNLHLYIDIGGVELEKRLQPGVAAMLAALQEKGFQQGKDVYFVEAPEAKHFEAAWAKRMPAALKLLFPPKP